VEWLEPRRLLAAGDPDLSFGVGGRAHTGSGALTREAMDAVVQADGKTVVVGYDAPTGTTFVSTDTPADFVVRRFNADGTPDVSFGAGGVVTTDFSGRGDQALAVAIDSKGRIVVGGKVQPQGTVYPRFGYARYLPSGLLDSSFGNGGKVLGMTVNTDGVQGIVVTSDDGVVAGGTHYSSPGQDMLVERLKPDGSIDAGFGAGGAVELNMRQNATGDIFTQDYIWDIALAPGGKIVLAGACGWPSNVTAPDSRTSDVALARLLPNGTPDATFGVGGKAAYHYGGSETALAVLALPDESLWVAGRSGTPFTQQSTLFRFTPTGQPDTTFDGDGMRPLAGGLSASDIAAGPNGTFLVAGSAPGTYPDVLFSVSRFTAAGAPDNTFDGDGQAKIDLLPGGADAARALAVRPDGGIVLAGIAPVTPKQDEIALARLTPAGAPDLGFGNAGKVVTGINVIPGNGLAVARQPDGKYLVAGLSDGSYNPGFRLTRFNDDGTLDATFGDRGTVKTLIGTEEDDAIAVIVRPDGKIWVAGSSYVLNAKSSLVTVPSLARYLPDGRLDPTFDGDGKKMFAVGAIGDSAASGGVIMQPDGKLVFAGSGRPVGSTAPNDVFLMRVDENANLDPTFGNNGVTWQSPGAADSLNGLNAVPGDGPGLVDFVVTGVTRDFVGSHYEYDAIVARFDDDGSPEWSRTLNFTERDLITAAAVNPADGSILLAGHTSNAGGTDDLLFAKLDSSGNLDGNFGAGGHVIVPFVKAYPWLNGVVFDADGGAVVAGYDDVGDKGNFMLMRVLPNGSLDPQFGVGGRVTLDVLTKSDRGNALLQQDDGKLVLVGQSNDPNFGQIVTSVARFRGAATLPAVTLASFKHDGAPGTAPNSIRMTFDVSIGTTMSPEDWQVRNLTTGWTVPAAALSVTFDVATRTATVTFPGLPGGVLPDGNYRATLAAGSVEDASGKAIGSDATLNFFVLAGDANRDRTVNFADLVAVAQHYDQPGPRTFAEGDFNGDGKVDFADLVLVAQRYDFTLPAPAAPAASSPALAAASARRDRRPANPLFSLTPVAKPLPKAPKPPARTSRR
jgi:uncharacterized delta-60 repeat protein